MCVEHEASSTRELAVKYTDEKTCFVSELFAYRILKAANLITAPDYLSNILDAYSRHMPMKVVTKGDAHVVQCVSDTGRAMHP